MFPTQHCADGLSLCSDTSRSFLQQWTMVWRIPEQTSAAHPGSGRGFFGPGTHLRGCELHHFILKQWQNYHLLGCGPPGKLCQPLLNVTCRRGNNSAWVQGLHRHKWVPDNAELGISSRRRCHPAMPCRSSVRALCLMLPHSQKEQSTAPL